MCAPAAQLILGINDPPLDVVDVESGFVLECVSLNKAEAVVATSTPHASRKVIVSVRKFVCLYKFLQTKVPSKFVDRDVVWRWYVLQDDNVNTELRVACQTSAVPVCGAERDTHTSSTITTLLWMFKLRDSFVVYM